MKKKSVTENKKNKSSGSNKPPDMCVPGEIHTCFLTLGFADDPLICYKEFLVHAHFCQAQPSPGYAG